MDNLPDKIIKAIDLELNKILATAQIQQVIKGNYISERKILEDFEASNKFKDAMHKLALYSYYKGITEGAGKSMFDSFVTAAKSKAENYESKG